MRKTALYVAAWFAAGIGAVTLTTAGVSMVGRQVTEERPSPLSAEQVRAELDGEEAKADTTTTVPSSTTTTTPTIAAPGTDSTGSGTGGAPGGGPPSAGGSTTPPTVAGARDDVDPAATATTAPPAPAPSETRTYSMTGGTATLRFSADGVTVVVATPNAGFSVTQEPADDDGVRVEFRSDEHRSRVEGWWDGGPRDEVDEED